MLPRISQHSDNGEGFHRLSRDDAISEADENTLATTNKFDESNERLSTIAFPTVDPSFPVKQRIAVLESTAEVQSGFNKTTHQTFSNLSANLQTTEASLRDVVQEVQVAFEAKLAAMKKEYDHMFELQASENKRLQHHVASLKSETSQMKRKLIITAEKLRRLQLEFGDSEELLEDEDAFSMTGGMSVLSSRPNTSNV